jgi:hypothetical protein
MIDYEMCYWSIKKWLIGQLAKVLLGGEKKKKVLIVDLEKESGG